MTRPEHETFCIYCQREFYVAANLREHVLREHPGTYRALAYLREKER